MNLRTAKNYSIGLDLGSGSVGWAVVDEDGKLYHVKGKPTWGSRLFPDADTAAATRVHRGQRRRYERRRQRLDYLQTFFMTEMEKSDPEFFIRLRQSRLWKEDRNPNFDTTYRWPLFNGDPFTEAEYYDAFPTIYHLRQHLMESDEQADIRLIYLALHNIVKYRGNFLHEDEGSSLKASNANAESSVRMLVAALDEYVDVLRAALDSDDIDFSFAVDVERVSSVLDNANLPRAQRAQDIQDALGANGKDAKNTAKAIARACVGYKVDFSNIFAGVEKGSFNFEVSNEDKLMEFQESCPDEGQPLLESILACYSSYVLAEILRGHQSISDAMVDSYDQHQRDLKTLKELVRDYLGKKAYNDLFRGPKDERGEYDINKLPTGSYTAYVMGEKRANGKGCSHEDLLKNIRKVCESSKELQKDERFLELKDRLYAEDSDFLKKQKTRENGAIPYQLHLEEMDAIIQKQGEYYPFLIEHKDELEKIVSSRIPYYVGPLNAGHRDPLGKYPNNPIDDKRKFGWSVRREGTESVSAHPWNVEQVIDTDETAERFIRRMTGTCTYLYGEPVLPRHSLLYEEFCVLNELNGARWAAKGEKPHRFDAADCQGIVRDLFMGRNRASVSYQDVKDWICRKHGVANAEVSGAQAENGFESKLTSYHDFCKVFGVRNLEDAPLAYDEIEEIILWSTVFEDRDILKRKLAEKYGDVLKAALVKKYGEEDADALAKKQLKKLANKRYAGWGRLSKKLLAGIRVEAPVPKRRICIMDVLREGNPFDRFKTMNFMETLRDDNLCFQQLVDKLNEENFDASDGFNLEDMPGSPQNRRAVNQAMRILDELVHIAGRNPKRICIEVTRDDDKKKKGKRTNSRYKQLKEAVRGYKSDLALAGELEKYKDELDDDRLLLYFQQGGKCMYSGEALDIKQLNTYHIDHIVPQSYIKDDSISNRVLVKSAYNERKLDGLIPDDVVNARKAWWHELQRCGLISEKKLHNLTRRSFSEGEMRGFISRQLVETSQVVKFVRLLCEKKYPGTEVVSVRANVSHGVRDNLKLVKCRELNDFHHAHDAFLACQVAEFTARCYPNWQDGQMLTRIRKYVRDLVKPKPGGKMPGDSGLIANGLTSRRYFDENTGEILWDNEEHDKYIRSALGYKDCYISRMTEEQTGAFWDETVYSPRDSRNGRGLKMPLKSSSRSPEGYLDPKKYGGVSSIKQAHWFIFAAKNKKGQYKYFFEGVPVYLADMVAGDTGGGALQEYANDIARQNGCGDAVILRKSVPLRQKLEIDGTQYYLYGSTGTRNELRPAKEMWAVYDIASEIQTMIAGACLETSAAIEVWEWTISQGLVVWPQMVGMLNIADQRSVFSSLDENGQRKVLLGILSKLTGISQTVDLTALGGSGHAGFFLKNIATVLPSITWIDQSVTGIFEKRTTFEDLTRGL